jgi:hypothetical protein
LKILKNSRVFGEFCGHDGRAQGLQNRLHVERRGRVDGERQPAFRAVLHDLAQRLATVGEQRRAALVGLLAGRGRGAAFGGADQPVADFGGLDRLVAIGAQGGLLAGDGFGLGLDPGLFEIALGMGARRLAWTALTAAFDGNAAITVSDNSPRRRKL